MASDNKPGTGTGVKSRERVLIEEPRQYKVIFHNDDFTTMEFVTDVLRRVFNKPADEKGCEQSIRELYLRGFEIAVRESQPWTVMSSYNSVNGQYSMGNHDLLTKILRDDWGYKGIVMTDWIGIREGLPTISEVHAGNDLMEPGQKAQAEERREKSEEKNGKIDALYMAAKSFLSFF